MTFLNLMNTGEGNLISRFSLTKMSTNTYLYIIFTIVIILLSIYMYYTYFTPLKSKFTANNESPTDKDNSANEAELMFFYADWCPHCKTAKPIWNDLVSTYENKMINGYRVTFTEINCSNETPHIEEMMNKYKIEGFPTFKLIKNGQVIEYDAKPSKETLTQFLQTTL